MLTGLGEGAFYSNDRSLVAEKTPIEKRSLGMGVVITGLALGITIATAFAPNMIELGGDVFADPDDAWRMPFLILGACTLVVGLAVACLLPPPGARPPLRPGRPLHLGGALRRRPRRRDGHLLRRQRRRAGATSGSPCSRSRLARSALVAFVLSRRKTEMGAVLKNRDLVLINLAFIAVLWNLWFFGFWSVSIVADAAGPSFGRSGHDRRLQRGRGHPRLPDRRLAVATSPCARGIGRKPLVVGFTAAQCVLTVIFGLRRGRRRRERCG